MNKNTLLVAVGATFLTLTATTALSTFAAEPATDTASNVAQTADAFDQKIPGGGHMMNKGKWMGWMGKGMHMMWFGWPGGKLMNEAAETALAANDYNAFVAEIAWTKMEGKVTQEHFTKMVEGHKKHAAIEAALEKNDYNAFVAATTPTQEEFAEMVKHHQERQNQTK